jgi:DnaK suppressor protein
MSDAKSPIDEAHARELLRRERERIESHLADLRRGRGEEVAEIDAETQPADEGELIDDEQVDDALIDQLQGELEAVERAEGRLEDGTYGLSVESGEPIPAARLEHVPWAERTAEEQETFERQGGAG